MTADPVIVDLVARLVTAGFDAAPGRGDFGDRVTVRTSLSKAGFVKAARLGRQVEVTKAGAGIYIVRPTSPTADPSASSTT